MSNMITGRLITAGRIATCENYSETTYGENLDIDVISGVLIVMDDNNVRAAAASMLGKEIEVRLPAPSDRASIVEFLHAKADKLEDALEEMARSKTGSVQVAARMQVEAQNARVFAEQIKRGDDVSVTAAPA